MAVDPEVIAFSSSPGFKAICLIPRWFLYFILGIGVLFFVGILKALFPLLLMSFLLGFIYKQAVKRSIY